MQNEKLQVMLFEIWHVRAELPGEDQRRLFLTTLTKRQPVHIDFVGGSNRLQLQKSKDILQTRKGRYYAAFEFVWNRRKGDLFDQKRLQHRRGSDDLWQQYRDRAPSILRLAKIQEKYMGS